MKKKILFAITNIMTLFISCKKDHTGSQNDAKIIATFSTEALTYVKLPLNSYYIYKDSATGILDSVVVTTSNSKLVDVPKYVGGNCIIGPCTFPAYTSQEFNLRLTKFTTSSQQDWFICTTSTKSYGIYLKSTDSVPLYLCGAFRYPFHSYTYAPVEIVSSLVIAGRIYSNVAIFANINGQATNANYLKTVYYWAKGVGIIKRETQTSTSIKTEVLIRNG